MIRDLSFFCGEKKCGYYVDREMKKIWACQLDILSEFMRICDKYSLFYYVSHGTLLGAVRHSGFIPWDDDIDVDMPRDDYEKLCEIAPAEVNYPYEFQEDRINENYFLGMARIRDSRTTGLFVGDCELTCAKGLWIDIFPRDGLIEDLEKRQFQAKLLDKYRVLNIAYQYQDVYETYYALPNDEWSRNVDESNELVAAHGRRWLVDRFVEASMMGNSRCQKRTAMHSLFSNREVNYWPVECVSSRVWVDFEDIIVPIPNGWEQCLQIKFKDYMKFPNAGEMGHKHLDHIMNASIPYSEYDYKIFTSFPQNNRGRKVVLFCAGISCSNFIERYGALFEIECIVDNDSNKVGQKKSGYDIKSFSDFAKVYDPEIIQIIICSSYFQEIFKQLDLYGISERYVHIKDYKYQL